MNSTIYFFGNFTAGYSQYPDDYTRATFYRFDELATAPTQLLIHRDRNIMYYAYVRRFPETGQWFGCCVVLNGIMLTSIHRLFEIFEGFVAYISAAGLLLKYSDTGELTAAVPTLDDDEEQIHKATRILSESLDIMELGEKRLPPEKFGISVDSVKVFDESEDTKRIINAIADYSYTVILKDSDYKHLSEQGHSSTLHSLNERNRDLTVQCEELRAYVDSLARQKKQYKRVIGLSIAVVVCAVGLFFLKHNLSTTQDALSVANADIARQSNDIRTLNDTINQLHSNLKATVSAKDKLQNEFSSFKNLCESTFPLIITNIEVANCYRGGEIETAFGSSIYSSSTMFLTPRITYTGVKTGESVTLKVKLYTPRGLSTSSGGSSAYSFSESVYISNGSNTKTFQGWGGNSYGHFSSGSYRFEIWYENTCLRAKTFTIY